MKKKLASILTVVALLAALPLSVSAETFSGADGWNVEFDGNSMNSTFRSSDIDDAVYQLQPGDDVNIRLNLRNAYTEATDWYMSNAVLDSLEDAQTVAEGGAYSYILTYIDAAGNSTLLFSSDEVGGETVNESGVGLHQATDSLEEYFYLGRLESGDNGAITLNVRLEGETQGNTYQDTWARLQMNFATELATTDSTTNNTTQNPQGDEPTSTTTNRGSSNRSSLVRTGDDSQIMLFTILTLIAGMVCLIAAIVMVKRRKRRAN